jgi:hypothetical protein
LARKWTTIHRLRINVCQFTTYPFLISLYFLLHYSKIAHMYVPTIKSRIRWRKLWTEACAHMCVR